MSNTMRRGRRRAIAISSGLLGLVALALGIRLVLPHGASPASDSRTRVVMCVETGEVFEAFVVRDGDPPPWEHPHTGRRTLLIPEKCYWTREGKAKIHPTYILLNESRGIEGPTICPDCGRTVVVHNPMPPRDLMLEALKVGK